jgi:DnaJ-domain-containing protein 1
VIVTFQSDGALLADFSQSDASVFRLVFDPANLEGDWQKTISGTVYGLQTCLAAAVVARIPNRRARLPEVRRELERGIQAGLAGMRRLPAEGHGPVEGDRPAFPFAAVQSEIRHATREYSVTDILQLTAEHRDSWTILEGGESASKRSTPLFGTARRVALRGAKELRHVPYQQFGDLFLVERHEIERLRTLRQLVTDYADDKRMSKPLSIAVFGPPGAGKSFGVKQVARAVLGSKTPHLEFNLAQFTDHSDLIGLMHQVRDKVLEGYLPVVFWDEFDSRDVTWLQYFLAPMQDGRFQDGLVSHPIGKSVFVFAGGTSYDFDSFRAAPTDENSSELDKQRWLDFKARKGPDFVSRLGGYVNVLGPNRRQVLDPQTRAWNDDPSDVSFPIRRALFLRAKLTESNEQKLNIDNGVLTALLEVSRYRHGSRSLEAILRQLRRNSRTDTIQRGDLPPADLLGLNVDQGEFLRLVERDVEFQGDVEQMAETYHEFYRAKFPGGQYDGPYSTLPEAIKDDNRAAARRIVDVLVLAGLYLTKDTSSATEGKIDEIFAIIERNLEILAEAEHDGWVNHKVRQGWMRVADKSQRRDELRLHHLLIPYRELPDEEKAKDRDAVRHYSDIVARQGYRIVCEPPSRDAS